MKLNDIIETLGDYMNDAVVIAEAEPFDEPGPRVVWCNRAFTEMTGYEPDEIVGKTPRILQGEDTDPETRRRIREGLQNWSHIRETILNYKKNGEPFWSELDIRPVADEKGWFHFWVAIQRDCTQRKENELELERRLEEVRKTQARLEEEKQALRLQSLVAAHTTDVAIVTDAEGRIVWVNAGFERLTEFALNEVVGRKPGDFLQGEASDPDIVEAMRDAIKGREFGSFELINYTKSGRAYWIEIRVSPVFNDAGELENFIAVEQDVTARKTAELGLVASNTDLRRALARADKALSSLKAYQQALDQHAIVAITDRKGDITFANDAFCAISGYSREELIGQNHRIVNSGYHPPEFFNDMWSTISNGEPWKAEICNRSKSGVTYWVDTTIFPLRGDGGRIESYVAIRYDISERKTAVEQLRLSQERFDLCVQGSADGIWDWEIDAQTVFYSPRFKELLGYEADDPEFPHVFTSFEHALHPDDKERVLGAMREHLNKGRKYDAECRLRCKGGHYRWYRARGQAIWNDAGRATRMAGGLSDIDDLVSARVTTEAALEKADNANRLKTEFLANMSHEIRTPLNGVLGMAQMLDMTELNDKQKRYVTTIESSGEALLSIINDVLDLSKIEAGVFELAETAFEVGDLTRRAAAAVEGIAVQKGVAVNVTNSFTDPYEVTGDEARIRQVLVNLAGNAVKFTDEGTVTLHVEPTPLGGVKFSVNDTGPGIAPDQQQRVFERFVQVDGSRTRKHGGTGLGLAISKDIVELMDGAIGVESAIGAGSTFWFDVPLKPGVGAKDAPTSHDDAPLSGEAQPAGGDAGRFSILVAEDNLVNQDMITECLALIDGVECVLVEDGKDALAKLENGHFDLVLMDINMPVMAGDEAMRRIRGSGKPYADVPIIALTANALAGQREAYLNAGATGYLAKPIDVKALIDLIERYRRDRSIPNIATA